MREDYMTFFQSKFLLYLNNSVFNLYNLNENQKVFTEDFYYMATHYSLYLQTEDGRTMAFYSEKQKQVYQYFAFCLEINKEQQNLARLSKIQYLYRINSLESQLLTFPEERGQTLHLNQNGEIKVQLQDVQDDFYIRILHN